MVRKGFCVAAVVALGLVMVAADAGQAQLLRRGRRDRSSSDDAVLPSPQTEVRQSNYFAPESVDTTRPAPVYLDVRLPANAEVTVEKEKTKQTGPRRSFISPPIAPGRTFVYELSAKWMENGQEVIRTRKVNVRAGQQVMVDFIETPMGSPEPERRARMMGRRRGS
jgi:uncharacterized protein (TIGR03000 family)